MTLQERTLVDETAGDDNAGHDNVGQDNGRRDNDSCRQTANKLLKLNSNCQYNNDRPFSGTRRTRTEQSETTYSSVGQCNVSGCWFHLVDNAFL